VRAAAASGVARPYVGEAQHGCRSAVAAKLPDAVVLTIDAKVSEQNQASVPFAHLHKPSLVRHELVLHGLAELRQGQNGDGVAMTTSRLSPGLILSKTQSCMEGV
jgi:hypothetical protein